MVQLWLLVYLTVLGLLCLLTTVVFCFWSLYLLQTVIHKWNIYKKALKYLKEASDDYHQQISAYNAETELVKNVFLFCINLTEWLAVIIVSAAYIWNSADIQAQCPNRMNSTEYKSGDSSFILCLLDYYKMQPNTLIFRSLAKNLFVFSLVLVSSLCTYLAGRYTQISWIRSNSIPHRIGIFVLYLVVIQFLAIFDSTEIVVFVRWSNTFLFTLAFIITLKEYRRLCMVINWTIVDLKVRRNKPRLVARHIRIKRMSNRIFTFIMIGVFTILCSEYIEDTLITLTLIAQYDFSVSSIGFLQQDSFVISNITHRISDMYPIGYCTSVLGIIIMSFPYNGYGLLTMYTIAWRLYKGKSGYQTHFPNPQLRA